jgi:acyl-CoA synthetase (AMP-forming)/AMP-acid ligase II
VSSLGLIAAAERHAERIAIEEADGATITYRELFARARRRAGELAPGDVVEVPALW